MSNPYHSCLCLFTHCLCLQHRRRKDSDKLKQRDNWYDMKWYYAIGFSCVSRKCNLYDLLIGYVHCMGSLILEGHHVSDIWPLGQDITVGACPSRFGSSSFFTKIYNTFIGSAQVQVHDTTMRGDGTSMMPNQGKADLQHVSVGLTLTSLVHIS